MEQINKIKTDWKKIILAYPDLGNLLQNLEKLIIQKMMIWTLTFQKKLKN